MAARLEAVDVTKVFRSGFGGRFHNTAVNGVSLAIGGARPTITAVVGESGSGKTTLTRLLLGFERPTRGTVAYRGRDLWTMRKAEWLRFRREVQAIFQDPFEVFNPFYRVDHALTMPLAMFKLADSSRAAHRLVEAALERVGLRPAETLGRYPHQLSGGQRQRVMIARALLLEPNIILADEPVSMVDASLRSTILETLFRLKTEAGISLIYVTHDLTTAYQIADNVVVLYGGAIAEAGDALAVIRAPRHPYTQALVDAVPSPDPDVSWGLEDAAEPEDSSEAPAVSAGCAFAPRCPHAMAVCWRDVPGLFRTEPQRAAACFLHRNDDVVSAADVAGSGVGPAARAPARTPA